MENVVYVIGAGLSQPLGLPVMSNFLTKSKDIHASDLKKYAHFEGVFKTISAMAVSKNFYKVDLSNIEEILSILSMRNEFGGDGLRQEFEKYIIDVIDASTPQIRGDSSVFDNGSWYSFFWGASQTTQPYYAAFICNLLNLSVTREKPTEQYRFICSTEKNPKFRYSIVTLNYDLVIENYVDYLKKTFEVDEGVNVIRSLDEYDAPGLRVAKLHGSIDTGKIIPPTSNKLLDEKINPTWKMALKLLSEANYIRFMGYSLPLGDDYIKYLLKAASMEKSHLQNLKNIDVVCKDPDKTVKKRYDEFITFTGYRFNERNIDIGEAYLKGTYGYL